VVKSLKDRLHREHMVSVAEVGSLEVWNVATMGVAVVAGEAKRVHEVLDAITAKLHALADAEVGSISRDVISGSQLPAEWTGEDGSPLWTPEEKREDDGE
jgi:uncharacterized protein